MFKSDVRLQAAAVGIVLPFLAILLPNLAVPIACVTACLFLFVLFHYIRDRRGRRYSLSALREIHERDQLPDHERPEDDGLVYCMFCGSSYDPKYPLCPDCQRKNRCP